MKIRIFPLVLATMLGLMPNLGSAQIILYGCTASLTGQPLTTNKIVDIDIVTGLASNPRNTGLFAVGGIAIQPSTGNLFALTTFVSSPANSLVQVDPATGSVTIIGSTGLSQIVEGDLAFNPLDGQLYGVQQPGGAGIQRNLFRINPSTGSATIVGSTGSIGDLSALAFNSSGILFAIDSGGTTNSSLLTINPNTGATIGSLVMNVNLGETVGMTFDPISGQGYVADGGFAGTTLLYGLDVGTGSLNPIGSTGLGEGLSGLTFVSVPEPSSFFLMSAALVVFGRMKLFQIAKRNNSVLNS